MNRVEPQFEGTLPRDFFSPKTVPTKREPGNSRILMTAIIASAVVASVAIVAWNPVSRPAAPVMSLDVPAPTPTPVIEQPRPVAPEPEHLAPRALPVDPVVRRAELVDIPIGTSGRVQMPDGHELVVTYRGTVPTFNQLPRNPQWSDMYRVTESGHAWVWCLPAGFNAPAWVDP